MRDRPTNLPKSDAVSRRACLVGAAILGAAVCAIASDAAELKKSKKEVSYQDQPKGKQAMCADCKFFQAPNACLVVEGTISPAGWCQRFEKKQG